jgi:hypothetical protein
MVEGKKLSIADSQTFDLLHSQLNSLDLDSTEVQTADLKSTVSTMNTNSINRVVWGPWWVQHLQKCEALIRYAQNGDYEKVAECISLDFSGDEAVNVNYQNQDGWSALHIAVDRNDLKLVNLLVKNHADVRS